MSAKRKAVSAALPAVDTKRKPRADSVPHQHATRSLPARYPPAGAWPAEMRADMAAAFLDFETTGQLLAANMRGEAPRPTVTRLRNGRQVPLWARDAIMAHLARRHEIGTGDAASDADRENIRELV